MFFRKDTLLSFENPVNKMIANLKARYTCVFSERCSKRVNILIIYKILTLISYFCFGKLLACCFEILYSSV